MCAVSVYVALRARSRGAHRGAGGPTPGGEARCAAAGIGAAPGVPYSRGPDGRGRILLFARTM